MTGEGENGRRGGKLGRHDALVVAVDKAGVPHSNDTNHHTSAGCPTHGEAPGPLDVHLQPGIQHRVHMAPAVVSLRIPETVLVVPLVVEDQGLDGARVVIPAQQPLETDNSDDCSYLPPHGKMTNIIPQLRHSIRRNMTPGISVLLWKTSLRGPTMELQQGKMHLEIKTLME